MADEQSISEWLSAGLAALGRGSRARLARRLFGDSPGGASKVSHMCVGSREVKANELLIVEDFIGSKAPLPARKEIEARALSPRQFHLRIEALVQQLVDKGMPADDDADEIGPAAAMMLSYLGFLVNSANRMADSLERIASSLERANEGSRKKGEGNGDAV